MPSRYTSAGREAQALGAAARHTCTPQGRLVGTRRTGTLSSPRVLAAHLLPPTFAPLLSPAADAGAPQEDGEVQPRH